MRTPKYIPEISPTVFWDVPIEEIDFDKDRYFIIPRVFNYGSFEEIADIIVCYGKGYVKEMLLSSTELNIIGLENSSVFMGIQEKQFKCYERIQHRLNS